ncbi:MAG: S-adenosylmethionine hydrolase [Saprospiraceae bacterium]|jgi:S-adenosylmethionine hydrolase
MDIVTLTTDFGTSDYYAAMLKGEILKSVPKINILDITHNVSRHDIMEAAFFVKGIYRHFPRHTLHLIAVNTYYAKHNQLILFEHDGYFFVGPNNGVFSLIFPDLDPRGVVEVPMTSREDIYHSLSKVIYQLSEGKLVREIGMPVQEYERRLSLQAVINTDHIRATIMHVDTFGNVIINVDKSTFDRVRAGRSYAIYFKSNDPITRLSHRYNDVPIGDVCAFFNDINMLEIAINMGNAHQLLSLNKNETIQIDFH